MTFSSPNRPPHYTRPGWRDVLIRTIACFALAWLATSAAIAQTTTPAPTTRPPLTGEAAEYQRFVEFLADPVCEGRGVGTAGIEKARAFIAGHFEKLGLQPIVRVPTPTAGAKPDAAAVKKESLAYAQPFDVAMGVRVTKQELATVTAGDAAKNATPATANAKPAEDFSPMGFSGSKAFEGQVVFVGYGIVNYKAPSRPDPAHPERAPPTGYDSFRGSSANALVGKVAMAFRYEPQDGRGNSLWAERDDAPQTQPATKPSAPGIPATSGFPENIGSAAATTAPATSGLPSVPSVPRLMSLNAIAGFNGSRWSGAASLSAKAEEAARRGAVALIIIEPPSLEEETNGALMLPSRTEAGPQSRIPVMHASAKWVRGFLRAAGQDPEAVLHDWQRRADRGSGQLDEQTGVIPIEGATLRGEIGVEHNAVPAHNVVAVLPGKGSLADRFVFVGAHYDHLGFGEFGSLANRGRRADRDKADKPDPERQIHPGADDNASGAAGVMLLAQRFARWAKQQPDSDTPGNARRSTVFVTFSGEERGLLGSKHLVAHFADLGIERDAVDAMVNFDMIGRLRDSRLEVHALETSKDWRKLLDDANREAGLSIVPQFDSPGLTDSHNFKLAKIPAIHFYTGMHSDYHRPSDTADKINALGAIRVLDLAESLIRRLATDEKPPRFSP